MNRASHVPGAVVPGCQERREREVGAAGVKQLERPGARKGEGKAAPRERWGTSLRAWSLHWRSPEETAGAVGRAGRQSWPEGAQGTKALQGSASGVEEAAAATWLCEEMA